MENKFCFLKGLVDCESGRIQDCNIKHVNQCPLEKPVAGKKVNKGKTKKVEEQAFCFLRGLVDCAPCDVQDCNMMRVTECPKKK